jgi:hypothetical protein
MDSIVSLHQLENIRRKFPYLPLHDRMIAEAEHVVRYNWSDVAIHDRRRLQKAPVGHSFAWVIGEFGSYFTPLFCSVEDKARWEASPLAPIQILCMRWIQKENPLTENKVYLHHVGPFYQKCFIVCKADDNGAGTLTPIEFTDLMDLCFNGQYRSLVK